MILLHTTGPSNYSILLSNILKALCFIIGKILLLIQRTQHFSEYIFSVVTLPPVTPHPHPPPSSKKKEKSTHNMLAEAQKYQQVSGEVMVPCDIPTDNTAKLLTLYEI